jgi:hypothetical protein
VDVPGSVLPIHEALAFQNDSWLVPLFNFHLLRLREAGFLDTIRRKYVTNRHPVASCADEEGSIGFTKTAAAFAILVLAVPLSLAVALCEVCVVRWIR